MQHASHKFVGLARETPDLDGPIGSAWEHTGQRSPEIRAEDDRIVAEWLVWCPLVSQFRAHWLVAAMDLTPSPVLANQGYIVDGATHELGIVAIDDSGPPGLVLADGLTLVSPPELTYQFAASGTAAVRAFARAVADAICRGKVFPEPGFIGGSGPYHGETLTLLLEAVDRAWFLTRNTRPNPLLKQAERPQKFWHIARSSLGGSRISPN
jgi:hypothetical protein